MKSSPDERQARIIRNPEVEGVIFCSPDPDHNVVHPNTQQQEEEEGLKALEDYWRDKGFQIGRDDGIAAGVEEGDRKGYERGFQEGFQKGSDEGTLSGKETGMREGEEKTRETFGGVTALFNTAVSELSSEKERLLDKAKFEIIEFSTAICEKILNQELKDRQVVSRIVEDMLAKVRSSVKENPVDVYFSPEQYALLDGHWDEIGSRGIDRSLINFQPSDSLSSGGCMVKTSLGLVNFDVSRQLENVKNIASSGSEG